MQHALAAIATSLLFTTVALAADDQAQPAKTEVSEDCSKQVWPNFTPACLRNADKAISVRFVTPNRR
jgi:hypothetical protein